MYLYAQTRICSHIISPPASRVSLSLYLIMSQTPPGAGNLDDTNLHKICLSCHIVLRLSEMQQRNEFSLSLSLSLSRLHLALY